MGRLEPAARWTAALAFAGLTLGSAAWAAANPVFTLTDGRARYPVATFDNVDGVLAVAVHDAGFERMLRELGVSVSWTSGARAIAVVAPSGARAWLSVGDRRVAGGREAGRLPFAPFVDVGEAFVPFDAVMRLAGVRVVSEDGAQATLALAPQPASGLDQGAAAGAIYLVRPGDDLEAIARAHGLSVAELARLNDLQGGAENALRPGDCLLLRQLADGAGGACPAPAAPLASADLGRRLGGLPTAASAWARELIAEALRFVGVPYAWGGVSPAGFDCSGFVQYVFGRLGVAVPRTADAQYAAGAVVGASELKPGDLVFFQTYALGPSHVGIYLGGGRFVSSTSEGVRIAHLQDGYWATRYLGARAIEPAPRPSDTISARS